MSLRDVWKRWNERPVDARGVADGCRSTLSLVEELAADPADFADLAHALRLDLRAVREALATHRDATPADLVAHLVRVRELCAGIADSFSVETRKRDFTATTETRSSRGGAEWVGWGRWTRPPGGAPVHPRATAASPATAAP
jgi:hypothetical protein